MLSNLHLDREHETSRPQRSLGVEMQANDLFDDVLRHPAANRLARLFFRPVRRLASLCAASCEGLFGNRHYLGTCSVPLDAIRGTLNRSADFDAEFRPINADLAPRWVRLASAMLRGVTLPPVELILVGDAYYVVDGHHRISVARALGYTYVDAVVTEWERATAPA